MTVKTIRYIQEAPGQLPAILWEEPMQFKSLFAAGDEICEQGAWYKVLAVEVRDEIQIVTLDPIAAEPDVAPVRMTGPQSSLFPD